MRWRFWDRDPDRDSIFIMTCVDCRLITDTSAGKLQREVKRWTLCERCRHRRNGFKGAGTTQKLGIE